MNSLPIPLVQLQAVASLAARRGGDYVLNHLHRRKDADTISRIDVKHTLDRESQQLVAETIRAAYPSHGLLGEENLQSGTSDWRWVIDPIDGTVNFYHGLPVWCVSVACQFQGETQAAAVYLPELAKLYEATRESPATCNGIPLQVAQTPTLDQAIIQTGADKSSTAACDFQFLTKIAQIAQRPRIYGAAAADICFVAESRSDAFFETGIYIWDIAAAALILERAGGRFEILKSDPDGRLAVLAAPPQLFESIKQEVQPLLIAD